MTLCRAQEVTLCKKRAELQTLLTLITTLWKQRKISGVCLVNSLFATRSCPESTCMYRKSHHSQFRQNILDKQQPIWTIRKRALSMIHGSSMKKKPSESWNASPRFRIPNKRPVKGYLWVDSRLTKTQVTSRPETTWQEVWSSMSTCDQKKALQQ